MMKDQLSLDAPELGTILKRLNDSGVDYVIVGGIGICAQLREGAPTNDLDILVRGANRPRDSCLSTVRKALPEYSNERGWGYAKTYRGFGYFSASIKYKNGAEMWLDALEANRYTPHYWRLVKRDCKKAVIAGVPVKVADLADSAIIKFGLQRDKDIGGIFHIVKSGRLDVDRFAKRVREFRKVAVVRDDLSMVEKKYVTSCPKIGSIIQRILRRTEAIPFRRSRKRLYPTREAKSRFISDAELEHHFSNLALDVAGVIARQTAQDKYPTAKEAMEKVFPRSQWGSRAWRRTYHACIQLIEAGAVAAFYDAGGALRFKRYIKYKSRELAELPAAGSPQTTPKRFIKRHL